MEKKLIITDDVAIDHLYHPVSQQYLGDNRQPYP